VKRYGGSTCLPMLMSEARDITRGGLLTRRGKGSEEIHREYHTRWPINAARNGGSTCLRRDGESITRGGLLTRRGK